ncbi:MutT/NUDIX hydrolase [Orpheovirus IHUMI-LCC2]|uniref:NUDIX hydrolase (MutT) n=1 Tax=Orpheovirus IHUMI-LCC2 TaxID=2023057 RepID=A0A2I2L3Q0_9VIRU|nr:MutT/NUDIX hydrolase [Orpheovirus IHUMI-LCC2]SNW62185.1 NUDIX hydrolase (MutT) [Orpheovirus IHUMI-LCC2]
MTVDCFSIETQLHLCYVVQHIAFCNIICEIPVEGAGGILLNDNKEYTVMVESNPDYFSISRGKRSGIHEIEYPGGKTEDGETSVETAIREIYEETGIVITPYQIINYVVNINPKNLGVYLFKIILTNEQWDNIHVYSNSLRRKYIMNKDKTETMGLQIIPLHNVIELIKNDNNSLYVKEYNEMVNIRPFNKFLLRKMIDTNILT